MRTITFLCISLILLLFLSCGNSDKDSDLNNPYDPNKPLVVSMIGPLKGGLGTRVVVSGENFGDDKSKVKLFFNDKESLILSQQSTAIYAMVPKQPGDLSTIKVMIETGKNEDGTPKYREAILEGQQFKYHIKATVTTVAGKFDIKEFKDGPALEATFIRPVMLAVDDVHNVFISDDDAKRVRFLSIEDSRVTTVISEAHQIWQCDFNFDFTRFFVVERRASQRPLLFKTLHKASNWQESDYYYDQRDDKDNPIAGNLDYFGLTADDDYVFMIAASGKRLVRVHQITKKVECIGENLDLDSWAHLTFNKKDKMIYISGEDKGRIYRFNPYYIPAGKQIPWLTQDDIEHIVGVGKGTAVEGNGKSAQLGSLEGITSDWDGNVYTADYSNHVIWKIDRELNATIIAGIPGEKGYKDGKPKESLFNSPYDVAATPDGILYVADTFNRVIRCIAIQ